MQPVLFLIRSLVNQNVCNQMVLYSSTDYQKVGETDTPELESPDSARHPLFFPRHHSHGKISRGSNSFAKHVDKNSLKMFFCVH